MIEQTVKNGDVDENQRYQAILILRVQAELLLYLTMQRFIERLSSRSHAAMWAFRVNF